jgi:WD40 repeat protein
MLKRSLAIALMGVMVSLAIPDTSTAQTPTPSQSPSAPAANSTEYQQLRDFLAARNWQAADQETRRILYRWVHPMEDVYGAPATATIPADVIQTIDKLWTDASNGRFGLSVQQRIWTETVAQHPNNMQAAVDAFGDRVGWIRTESDPDTFYATNWLTEPELNFSLNAPEGYFPWAGISWERISSLFNEPGCGSCSIDAAYLQGDRFYRYLPGLYERVKIALDPNAQVAQTSWQTPRLQSEINLRTLYPNSACPINPLTQVISPNSQFLAISSYSYERSGQGCSDGQNSTLAVWNPQRGTRVLTLLRGQATEAMFYRGSAQEPMTPATEQTAIVGEIARAVAFTPDSRFIVAGLSNGAVRVWNTGNWQIARTFAAHQYSIHAIAISPGTVNLPSGASHLLATASSDQTIKIWNLQTGQLIHTLTIRPGLVSVPVVHTLLITPDGRRLVSATGDSKLQLWDIQTGRLIRTFTNEPVTSAYRLPIALSPDGRSLATADVDRSVKLWNTENGARLLTLRGHEAEVRSLAFSPNGQLLASNSEDNTIRLWNLQDQRQTRVIRPVSSVGQPQYSPIGEGNLVFSADGRTLASSIVTPPPIELNAPSPYGVKLWRVSDGQELSTILGVSAFNFSPNNQLLITRGQTVRVWQPTPTR